MDICLLKPYDFSTDSEKSFTSPTSKENLPSQPQPQNSKTTHNTALESKVEQLPSMTANEKYICCNRKYKSLLAMQQHQKAHSKCVECDYAALAPLMVDHQHLNIIHPIYEGSRNLRKYAKKKGITALKEPYEERSLLLNLEPRLNNNEDTGPFRKRQLDENQSSGVKRSRLSLQSELKSAEKKLEPREDTMGYTDKNQICSNFLKGSCRRGKKCPCKHDKVDSRVVSNSSATNPVVKENDPPRVKRLTKEVWDQYPNLLSKLFDRKIAEDRDTILQCIEYIANKMLE